MDDARGVHLKTAAPLWLVLIDDGGGTGRLAAGEVNAASSAVSAIRQISLYIVRT